MGLFDTVKKVVAGDVAHDAADSGNPIKFGGKAATSAPAAVSSGDRVDAWFDLYGALANFLPNLEKAEDTAHTTGDKGVMLLAVRKDTATALAGTDGDYIPLIVDSSGRLRITPAAGDVADDSVDSGNPVKIGGKAYSTTPAPVDAAGDRVDAWFDLYGALATFLPNLEKAEDTAHTTGDKGVMLLAVRKDTAEALAGSDGDYIPLTTDDSGRLRTSPLTGDTIHDTADAGNPVKIGGKAVAATPNPVTANDRVNAFFDLYGRQVVKVGVMSHEPPNEYSGHWTSGSVAASAYGWGFENPAASGKTYLIDQIWIGSAEAATISLHRCTTYTATDNGPEYDDLRQSGVSATARLLSNLSVSAKGVISKLPYYAGEKILFDYNGALKLAAGQALALYKEAGSTTGVMYMVVMWREE